MPKIVPIQAASLRIPASLEHLPQARAFVNSRSREFGLPAELGDKLDLVLEELLVNVGSYAYPGGSGELEIRCTLEGIVDRQASFFCLCLRDWGVAFDPLSISEREHHDSIDDMEVGGLGITLIRHMVDECTYRRVGDMNEFRACFVV